MVVISTLDGPATHTHSKTLTPTDTTLPTGAKSTSNKVSAPQPITEDFKDGFHCIQKTNPFSKHILKWLLNGKAPSHEVETFTHIKSLL